MVSFEVILIALAACLFGAFVLQTVLLQTLRRKLRADKGRIEEASCRDDLTGLLNRRVFQEILGRELAHARRNDGCVGVAILDVDGLELINDGLGVAAGDEVLETLAKRLERRTRESDILARLGGDELAILIGKCESTTDVLTAIYRLRSIWQEPIRVRDHELKVSCCVGLSVFPDDADGRTELLVHAGQALAKAKERGFDSLCIFDEDSDRQALARLEWRQELRKALERDELELYLQPQISLRDGRLVGAEGLVRWRHPREGLLTAGHFVPLAEQLGLMPSLSRWVLKEICSRSAEWLERGLPLVPLSVNVSVRHFQKGDVPSTVAECLEETGLDARFLHLEVTESAALHDVELMSEQFERLKELGVSLQLDDFGTGYSSLSYLLRYPLDVLKIDRSFVQELHLNEHSEAIVKGTLAMARSLGLEVVAEGVETVEEYRRLVQLGCRTAQGFLFARPMPREEFEKLVIAGRIELPGSQAA